jgi:predicted metalloprotease with PDZ domain
MTRRTLLLAIAFSVCALAQDPIRYTVRFPAPHTHYLEVATSLPAQGPALEVFMAVWTPGSYLVREYSRNVEDFQATANGKPLSWTKSRKNRWLIRTGGAASVELRYKVYAHEISVQGNWVDAGFAMLNGAPNFVTPVGRQQGPYEVTLDLPKSWTRHISGMKLKPGSPNTYIAADFDELLDSPIYAGNGPIHEFEVEGKQHYLVNQGEGDMWDGPASARDVAKIVAEYSRMWGGLPYDKYVFFNMLIESGGGLEHRNSTWLNASRWAYAGVDNAPPGGADPSAPRSRRPTRQSWLGLVSHEYFHLWNVKRLRPVELGPFDFENEVYTRSLWFAEGVTSYYGPLALARARLTGETQAIRAMGGAIAQLQTTPGRLVQPVETASYDAWIKLYRPNENSGNTSISYYTKGQVIGFLLDARIRKLTSNAKSLDDAMVLAYKRYGWDKGFTPDEFRKIASEVAGSDLSAWFRDVLETTNELDYSEALDFYGLRFRPASTVKSIVTGATVSTASGRLIVTRIQRNTAAWNAGLNVDDELIAVEDNRLRNDQWPSLLDYYKGKDRIKLLINRRDKLVTIDFPIVEEPPASWTLEVRSDATAGQKANLNAWLRQ